MDKELNEIKTYSRDNATTTVKVLDDGTEELLPLIPTPLGKEMGNYTDIVPTLTKISEILNKPENQELLQLMTSINASISACWTCN